MDLSASTPTLPSIVEEGLRRGLSFSEMCMACKGATPIAIRTALLRFEGGGALKDGARRLLQTAGDAHELRPELDERLPVPHPLDFDWRFSSATAEALAVNALAVAGSRAPILLVGVPSVLLAIGDHPNLPPIWFASRGQDPITTALKRSAAPGIRFIDIKEDLGTIEAAVSVVDPPWYDDIARWMVAKAASGTAIDGEVWVAGPDSMTGLSAAPRLSRLDADPYPFGLRQAQVSALLRYDTPPFEMLALRRNGILNVPPTWRTGRLYRCTRLVPLPETTAAPTANWEEHGTDRARVWIRPSATATPFVVAESRGMSRWDPERTTASLWTSGHRYSLGPLDAGQQMFEVTLQEICAHETKALNELVSWKGRYGVQNELGGFRLGGASNSMPP